ncbi:hypothetical protein [Bacillus sp. PK3_68]|uniref:hypothetical protein n=1 Tax=Bacillus sp. PK3_68 TaxID=2027408 RepID=UPI000E7447C0|nr:hypothetical protein [Bacillus sp. PK3_68]RJS50132.1 hypothetical protein CJ483_22845 [Bacillus sp. PK3_68]
MNKCLFRTFMAIIVFSLFGCQPNTVETVNVNKEKSVDGFIEPEPSDWGKYNKIVLKYMYYRTQAVINNDMNLLWNQYPDLKRNYDLQKGVNVERNEAESLNEGFNLIDANYSIESHDRMKVKVIGDKEVIALVHGGIVYLHDDYSESGGELLIEISLKVKDGRWTVVKTDEYTESEYKEWMKKQNK